MTEEDKDKVNWYQKKLMKDFGKLFSEIPKDIDNHEASVIHLGFLTAQFTICFTQIRVLHGDTVMFCVFENTVGQIRNDLQSMKEKK